MRRIVLAGVCLLFVHPAFAGDPAGPPAPPQERLRAAHEKAVALLVDAAAAWPDKRTCVSCHHQLLPTLAFDAAYRHGARFDRARAADAVRRGYVSVADLDHAVQATRQVDPAVDTGSTLAAAAVLGVRPNGATTAWARLLVQRQRPDGSWITIDGRPPQSYGPIGATAYAARAVDAYARHGNAEWDRRADQVVERARGWLRTAPLRDNADRVMQLTGLLWTRADPDAVTRAADALRGEQLPSGGWAQLAGGAADPYATGSTIVALRAAGVPATDPAIVGGLSYLLATQEGDGSWHVQSRIGEQDLVSPPHFESGFPHGSDQMISAMATAYASMALASALPVVTPDPGGFAAAWDSPPDPAWVRTVQSGSLEDLAKALDAGLSPNATTAAGTSILMVAAPDLARMTRLVERGADPNLAAPNGITPLMVAANSPGSAAAVRMLLDHGARPVTVTPAVNEASAVGYAIWSGDTATLDLLLAKGAPLPTHMSLAGGVAILSPLDLAVLQHDEAMVRAIVRHGGDVTSLDEAGLPPLSQATLSNDPAMVRLLLSLGADPNQVDQGGETPLMHASQTDFGDSAVLELLLGAGARRDAVDRDGRTARELAERLGFGRIAAALGDARSAAGPPLR